MVQMTRYVQPETHRARQLRRASTPAEALLWDRLRSRRLMGAKFRRQQPIGPDIADFYCHEALLVVEADGAPHFSPPPAQQARDAFLRMWHICVLRFENCAILDDPDAVISTIEPWSLSGVCPLSLWERGKEGEGQHPPGSYRRAFHQIRDRAGPPIVSRSVARFLAGPPDG